MRHTELRKNFLEFFSSKGHTVVPSDSLVPAGDPTLLFTSAGMNQFKEQFLGNIKGFRKAASCQKCLRTGDLENVGKTAYHHTFFEMLGNFSFGDYFKKDAIAWAWEFMKDVLKIPQQKMWVSVYIEDDEAYDIWRRDIGIPNQKIVRLGQKENFWPSEAKDKGPNGPCGPCSEIFYDYGEGVGCRKKDCSPACSCGRFVEVWNLVFTQFNRKEGGVLEPLPSKNIDTGMGLERLCAVTQGAMSNFETDLFVPITKAIRDEVASQRMTNNEPRTPNIYAIADHARAATFAICEGITPSNEERGYVIRNIIRKAVLHGKEIGIEKPFLYKLAYTIGKVMQEPYPEILKRHQDIAGVIKVEEERFASTLRESMRLLEESIEDIKKSNKKVMAGKDAFKLFDTHGLPLVIIKDIAKKEGISVDEWEFERLLEAQREQSRKMSQMHTAVFVDTGMREKTEFIGYDKNEGKAIVLRILDKDGKDMDKADKNSGNIDIILDKSVFYGESGGQVGDKGTIKAQGLKVDIEDAKKIQDAILLFGKVKEGVIKKGDIVDTYLDKERRLQIAKNHTATHLLQAALRKVLGEHVHQQGSLVAPDRLRFDFTHVKALTQEQLERVEELVNQYLKEGISIETKEMDLKEARDSGALAFFGEKYDQKVRVVSAGVHSRELCGGTHLKKASDIGLFKIMREGSVASGIRRIEAVTSDAATEWIKEQEKLTREKEEALHKKQGDKKLAKQRLKEAEAGFVGLLEKANDIAGVKLIVEDIEGADAAGLKRASDIIRTRSKGGYAAFLVSSAGNKLSFVLSISENLTSKGLNAGSIISLIAKSAGGSGGGRPNIALGGAKDAGRLNVIKEEAKRVLTMEIKK